MGFSAEQFARLPDRFKPESERPKPIPAAPHGAVKQEAPLHEDIIKFCNEQFPRWKCIHSRMDMETTTEPGIADFIIFAPGRVLIIECKTKDGKLSTDQLGWKLEIEKLGHEYHVVRSMDEFKKIVYGNTI